MPLFSVIVPTYNRLELLRQALASVWAQTLTDYEVTVIDDGSTDRTVAYLTTLSDRLRFVHQENKGPGAARNFGIREANGDYIAFLDSDDIWFPWTLATYREIIERWQQPAFIAGKPFRFQSEKQLEMAVSSEMHLTSFPDYLASGDEWRWWGVSSFLVRRDAFKAVGGFADERINGEDADLALRLGVARGFVQVNSPVTFGYREHAESLMKNVDRTLAGIWYLVRIEQAGLYPGGEARAVERRRILTRHLRPASLDCLRHGLRAQAWELYRATFTWHTRLGRWKYLGAFPVLAVMATLRARRKN